MQKRHSDKQRYFNEQVYTTEKYVIPFIQQEKNVEASLTVLEIGCGEGGNLKPFVNLGCTCVGMDLSQSKIDNGMKFYTGVSNIDLICRDVYDTPACFGRFDLLIIRDVIEHIHDQDRFLGFIKQFLNEGAVIFVAFPPWQNPFGGHQQMCRNKFLSVLPFFHLLPRFLYKGILKTFGENDATVKGLLEIKETGISIERFEKLCRNNQYDIRRRTLYFINPNYEVKFGLKPRETYKLLSCIPYLKNFYNTCGYYLITVSI
ncbi:MAG: class I SAM-dependent methyltransferase [Paludibacter sp.]|nr:class I SAM-dependent methyltransferase [Paludibacter sp.]MDD4198267.1 class I SAM-dependent methyltransferase [Paludibacter sp.]MDD4428031.1 class I SAM-dependent methyltransferase [Paludibacter sp.]